MPGEVETGIRNSIQTFLSAFSGGGKEGGREGEGGGGRRGRGI